MDHMQDRQEGASAITRALRFFDDKSAARAGGKIASPQIFFVNFPAHFAVEHVRAAHLSSPKRSAPQEIEGATSAPSRTMRCEERKDREEASSEDVRKFPEISGSGAMISTSRAIETDGSPRIATRVGGRAEYSIAEKTKPIEPIQFRHKTALAVEYRGIVSFGASAPLTKRTQ
jgi:hypothetical protein